MVKKVLNNGITGFGIGMTIYVFISLFFVDNAIRKTMLSCMLMTFMFGLTSSLFEEKVIEKYGLLKVTIAHFISCIVIYFCVAYYNQWLPNKLSAYLGSVLLFFLIYVCIWCFIYVKTYFSIKKINQQLKDNE